MGTLYPYVVDANTLALINFNEGTGTTAADDTDNDYDFTLSNEAAWSDTAKFGAHSLYPNALYHASQGTLLDTVPAAGTVEFHFCPDVTFDSDSTAHEFLLYKRNLAVNCYAYILFYLRQDDGLMRVVMERDDCAFIVNMYSDQSSWTADQWYHVALTWGATGMKLYIDGLLNDSNAQTGRFEDGTNLDFGFGYSEAHGGPFNGKMDELRVSNVQRTDFTGPAPAAGGKMTPRTKWWGDI